MAEPLEIVRQVGERWNAGDFDGLLELYADDVTVHTGEHWPERHILEGKDAFRESIDEWVSVWESIAIETDHVEAFGERVVAQGGVAIDRSAERSRGNAADPHRVHGPGWEDRSC